MCISVPVILGWGVLQAVYLGFFDAVMGIALLVVFTALVLSVIVYGMLLVSDKAELARQELERERTVLEQERYGLLKRFVTNTRHDLATPLSSIITNTYLLRRSSDPVKQSTFLDRVEQETTRITHILEQFSEMMHLNEMESLIQTDVDLKNLVELIISEAEVAAKQKGVRIHAELTMGLPPIPGDPAQLHLALTQLFDNALRYSQPEGQITIKLYPGNQNEITFDISDVGPGIEPEKFAHVFDLQYKGNEARTGDGSLGGFGLSIVKRIVDLHKGQIEIESISGQGTTVRLIFRAKL
ncbi:HAMP domain-containing histidine kinase [bacterium]|nr:HAMP domain-containing histidine kinase [bacterium]